MNRCLLCLALLVGLACRPQVASEVALLSTGPQAACDSMVRLAPGDPVRLLGTRATNTTPLRAAFGFPYGFGIAEHPLRYYLLDRDGILGFDSTGTLVDSIGRAGEGPGEFNFLGASMGEQRLAVIGDTLLAVLDGGGVLFFRRDGRLVGEVPLGAHVFALARQATIAPGNAGDAWVGFPLAAGAGASFEERSTLQVVQVLPTGVTGVATRIASAARYAGRLAPDGTFWPHPYFPTYFSSVFGTQAGIVSFLSQSGFGVCALDPRGGIEVALHLDAPTVDLGPAGLRKYLDEHPYFEERDRGGFSVADQLRARWPAHAPFDLGVEGRESFWWVRRPAEKSGHRGVALDFVQDGRYVGSTFSTDEAFAFLAQPRGHSLVAYTGKTLTDEPELITYTFDAP